VEGADQVLAGCGVDAGLAADRGVDHPEQGGRHVHDRHAAQPGGGHEPREVGHRSPAQRHHRVRAREAPLAQRVPAVRGDRRGLGVLAVGQPEGEHVVVADQGVERWLGEVGLRAGVEERHAFHAVAEDAGQAVQQVAADDHVVRRRAAHRQHGG
jgi:hypothetical protein